MIKESQHTVSQSGFHPFALVLKSGRLGIEYLPDALPFQTIEVDNWDLVFKKLSAFRPGCLLIDFDQDRDEVIRQVHQFADQGIRFSIVGISSDRSRRTLHQAMRIGFIDLIPTPIQQQHFVDAVQEAFHADSAGSDSLCKLRSDFGTLTPKEREVLPYLLRGLSSRRLAREFTVTYQTIDRHRKHVEEKMKVRNMTELAMKLYRQY